jgi:hypothetical protein
MDFSHVFGAKHKSKTGLKKAIKNAKSTEYKKEY